MVVINPIIGFPTRFPIGSRSASLAAALHNECHTRALNTLFRFARFVKYAKYMRACAYVCGFEANISVLFIMYVM